jgi:hypothetical protein
MSRHLNYCTKQEEKMSSKKVIDGAKALGSLENRIFREV